jgi:hypothetical protein
VAVSQRLFCGMACFKNSENLGSLAMYRNLVFYNHKRLHMVQLKIQKFFVDKFTIKSFVNV